MSVAVAIAIIISGMSVVVGALAGYTRWIYRRGQGSILREASQAKETARIEALETEISNLKAKLDSMLRRVRAGSLACRSVHSSCRPPRLSDLADSRASAVN